MRERQSASGLSKSLDASDDVEFRGSSGGLQTSGTCGSGSGMSSFFGRVMTFWMLEMIFLDLSCVELTLFPCSKDADDGRQQC